MEHSVDKPNKKPLVEPAKADKGAVKTGDEQAADKSGTASRGRTTDGSPTRRDKRSDYTSPSRAKDLIIEALKRKQEEEEKKNNASKVPLTAEEKAEQEKKELLGELSM